MKLEEIKRLNNIRAIEEELYLTGYRFIAGVDEVGKGCLAGPIVAAAVILDIKDCHIDGIDDSKKLTIKKREGLYKVITKRSLSWSVAEVSPNEIDNSDILKANKKVMEKAIKTLKLKPEIILSDNLEFDCACDLIPIINGDELSISIAAASIIAKVVRDKIMQKFSKLYPEYGFEKNKGYGTAGHIKMLQKYGPCNIHRISFRNVLS